MPSAGPDPGPPVHGPYLDRFRAGLIAALDAPWPDDLTLGVAVSGGPDSLALLLLADAALPGRVRAATVDHGLRPGSEDEARMVADLCRSRAIPHRILNAGAIGRAGGMQAAARDRRYALLGDWCRAGRMTALATAHHVDDQAETVLLRLARGSGVAGLSGIRCGRPLLDADGFRTGVRLVRPVLDFGRQELGLIVRRAGLTPVDDPSNASPDYDRTHARRLLSDTPWLAARRVAAVAGHMADAEAAREWATDEAERSRIVMPDGREIALFDPAGLPGTIRRRLVVRLLNIVEDLADPIDPGLHRDGPAIGRLIDRVSAGTTSTLGRVQVRSGARWTFRPLVRDRRR